MADFFRAGWSLNPSRSADSKGQERRQAVEHALTGHNGWSTPCRLSWQGRGCQHGRP